MIESKQPHIGLWQVERMKKKTRQKSLVGPAKLDGNQVKAIQVPLKYVEEY